MCLSTSRSRFRCKREDFHLIWCHFKTRYWEIPKPISFCLSTFIYKYLVNHFLYFGSRWLWHHAFQSYHLSLIQTFTNIPKHFQIFQKHLPRIKKLLRFHKSLSPQKSPVRSVYYFLSRLTHVHTTSVLYAEAWEARVINSDTLPCAASSILILGIFCGYLLAI